METKFEKEKYTKQVQFEITKTLIEKLDNEFTDFKKNEYFPKTTRL